MRMKLLMFAVIVCLLISAGICAAAKNKYIDPRACSIKITSNPSGAKIYGSGIRLQNRTPYTMADLVPGSYKIELIKDGYKEYKTTVKVAAGEEAEVNAVLEKVTDTENINADR